MLHKVYEHKDFFLDMKLPLSDSETYQRIIKMVDRSKFLEATLGIGRETGRNMNTSKQNLILLDSHIPLLFYAQWLHDL